VLATAVGSRLVAFDRASDAIFELSPVAAHVWRYLQAPQSFDHLRDRLLGDYDVPEEQCARDLQGLLADLEKLGLVEARAADDGDRRSASGESEPPSPSPPDTRPSRDAAGERRLPPLAREFRLCVECCRWNFTQGSLEEARRLAAAVDWPGFIRLARYHRVQGLVWNCLSRVEDVVPAAAAQALAADASAIAATSLRHCAECDELLTQFTQRGLSPLFVKGLTLGRLAYANPFLKMAWDIDLLIAPQDLAAAAGLLEARGYAPVIPASAAALSAWHGREKESVWERSRDGLYIELHTRLADNLALIPTLDTRSPRQQVEVAPSIVLPTLEDRELFAYLAVHGASSAWFRLKWIVDFAAFLHGRSGSQVEHFYKSSQDLGAGRAAGQALLLADALFDTLAPVPALRRQLDSDWPTRRLFRAALRMVTREPVEPTQQRLGTLIIHWTQFLLLPGAAYKLAELRRQAGKAIQSERG
jgi:hypothetical protein